MDRVDLALADALDEIIGRETVREKLGADDVLAGHEIDRVISWIAGVQDVALVETDPQETEK